MQPRDTRRDRWPSGCRLVSRTRGGVGSWIAFGTRPEGRLTTGDTNEAIRWYQLAAEGGNTDAMYQLGSLYTSDAGLEKDRVRGHMWFNLAVAHGMRQATQRRDSVEAKMSPEEIAQAEKLAVEWTQRKAQ